MGIQRSQGAWLRGVLRFIIETIPRKLTKSLIIGIKRNLEAWLRVARHSTIETTLKKSIRSQS